jgi:hypothetical protein
VGSDPIFAIPYSLDLDKAQEVRKWSLTSPSILRGWKIEPDPTVEFR